MHEEELRDFYGRKFGTVECYDNGDRIVRNWPEMQIVAFYYKATNRTEDFYHRVVAQGDTTVAMLYKDKKM